jgi:transposase-like protein
MSKRKFTAEFKAKLVLEMLTGEDTVGSLALLHHINPHQLQTWKRQFLEKAPNLFADEHKAAKEAAEREAAFEEKQAAMLKTIGQLTLERDFLMAQAHERNKGVLLRRG